MWRIDVEKYTDLSSLRMANSFTSGNRSKMTLARAYALGHSPIRTQRFYIKMFNIPLFCASQFVRSTQGVQWYQRTKRIDRGGEDFRQICKDIHGHLLQAYADSDDDKFVQVTPRILELPEKFDRYAPTDLLADCNAEFIINMSRKRLCYKASAETRILWEMVIDKLSNVDLDLAKHCVKPCVACGVCKEHPTCGFMSTAYYYDKRYNYTSLFYDEKNTIGD